MPGSIRDALQGILEHYRDTAPGSPWGKEHPTYAFFSSLSDALAQSPALADRKQIKLSIAGRGRQSALAYVALLDTRVTRSPQEGVYCVYLFREDLSAVYLTLAIGVTKPPASTH